ncbi:MAG: hypothetical protein EZS28_009988 [Streblomastix strix]|uniref:Protein kinase domain-containing protein n=1 Tax=Streblomastix strix TaxID=222440 RepID=A0A5J4WIY1_9EUKA|nr:MAG: hypothetical protein EZS28_009988 [Streblomastix strix]
MQNFGVQQGLRNQISEIDTDNIRIISSLGFTVVCSIGSGQFGQVYKVFDKCRNLFAIKVQKKELYLKQEWDAVINIFGDNQLGSENLIRVFGKKELEDRVIILMAYANLGNLLNLIDAQRLFNVNQYQIQQQGNQYLEERVISIIMRQILTGLNDMHNAKLVHCDIKPDNILLDRKLSQKQVNMNICEAMICDYGETNNEILANKQMSLKPIGGTSGFQAPEILTYMRNASVDNWQKLSGKIDIFSAGTVLFQLAMKYHPYITHVVNDISIPQDQKAAFIQNSNGIQNSRR